MSVIGPVAIVRPSTALPLRTARKLIVGVSDTAVNRSSEKVATPPLVVARVKAVSSTPPLVADAMITTSPAPSSVWPPESSTRITIGGSATLTTALSGAFGYCANDSGAKARLKRPSGPAVTEKKPERMGLRPRNSDADAASRAAKYTRTSVLEVAPNCRHENTYRSRRQTPTFAPPSATSSDFAMSIS